MAFRVVSSPSYGTFGPLILQHAAAAGLDPELVRRVVKQESGFDPDAKNAGSGATGLMQVMEGTARDPGYGVQPIADAERTDPDKNLRLGTSYLSKLKQQFGDERTALIAYNWGPGNAAAWKKAGGRDEDLPPETRDYVTEILNGYDPTAASAAPTAPAAGKRRFKVVSAPAAAPAAGAPPVEPPVPPEPSAPLGNLPAEGVTGTARAGLPPGGVTANVEGMPGAEPEGRPAGIMDVLRFSASPVRTLVAPTVDSMQKAVLEDPGGAAASLGQSVTANLGDDVVGLVSGDAGEAIRGASDRFHEKNPGTALVTDLAGGVATGLGLNAGLRAAGAALPGVAGAVPRFLAGFEPTAGAGTTARNATRLYGQGAILGGVDAAGRGEDPAFGATVGGLLSAGAGAAAEGGTNAVRGLLNSRAGGPIRALAKRLGEPASALAERWVRFQEITGRPMSILEASDPTLAQELSGVGKARKSAERVLVEADTEGSRLRPGRTADLVTGENTPSPLGLRRPAGNVGEETVAQDARMTAAMTPIRGNPVAVTADEFNDIRNNQWVRRAVREDPNLQRTFARVDEELAPPPEPEGGWGPYGPPDPPEAAAITIDDIEALRQSLSAQSEKATPGVRTQIAALSQRLRAMGADDIHGTARYGDALDRYGVDARRITGMEEGRAGRTLADADTVAKRRDLATVEGQQGIQEGLRGRLRDEGLSSETGALRTLNSLAEDAGLARTMRGTFGEADTARLRTGAETELTAAERLRVAGRGVAPTDRQKLVDLASSVAETGAIGLAPASAWYKIRAATRVLKSLSMSKRTAEALARMAVTPGRAQQTIDAMLEEGLTQDQIRRFYQVLATPAGAEILDATDRE